MVGLSTTALILGTATVEKSTLTLFVTAALVDLHVALLTIDTSIVLAPVTKVGLVTLFNVNVDPVPIAVLPLIVHAYIGVVPPLVGVAVKVIFAPEHIDVAFATKETEGGSVGLTVTS
jgi:hypothetical protein